MPETDSRRVDREIEFDVKSGKYLVRQVVRDSEGSQMAALNGAVDIPSWGGRRALAGKDSND